MNKMNKKVFLVIQGHTQYCDTVLNNVKEVENVIWSTDTDAPEEHLNKIENSNVNLVVSDKPEFSGYGNVNVQVNSTIVGLEKAKLMGATHAIKMRSDLIFTDPKKFIDNYSFNDKIHQMAYCEHLPSARQVLDICEDVSDWIEKNYSDLINEDNGFNRYICDFANLGPIDDMILFWSLPHEEEPVAVNAEFKFLLRYFTLKKYENIDLSYEWYSTIFPFFIAYCKETNNPLISLKRGWTSNDLLNNTVDAKWLG